MKCLLGLLPLSVQVGSIIVQNHVECFIPILQNIQANIAVPELIHLRKRAACEQGKEAAHGPAVHTNQNVLFFCSCHNFLQTLLLSCKHFIGALAAKHTLVQVSVPPGFQHVGE